MTFTRIFVCAVLYLIGMAIGLATFVFIPPLGLIIMASSILWVEDALS